MRSSGAATSALSAGVAEVIILYRIGGDEEATAPPAGDLCLSPGVKDRYSYSDLDRSDRDLTIDIKR